MVKSGTLQNARDGLAFDWHAIPDGFYLVGDTERPTPEFQHVLIDAVRKVTHIAEADERGCIIGEVLQQAASSTTPSVPWACAVA
jgi:hypothetical protein